MQRIWTTELGRHAGRQVRLAGWLHRQRRLSQRTFLILRDAQGLAQVVLEDPAAIALLDRLHAESVLGVEGEAVAEAQAPGGVEVRRPRIEVIAPAAGPPPVDLFRRTVAAQLPTVLDHAAVALRHPRRRAILRLAAASLEGFRAALRADHFVEIQTPKMVAAASESGANLFTVDYFGRPAFLAQSPQLYKQILVGVFERVFETGPVFRAEPHDTQRHLSEYVSLDAELGFIEDHRTVMEALCRALDGMLDAVAAQAPELVPDRPHPIPTIHFTDALELIARGTNSDPRGELDLAPVHEQWLGEWARHEFGSDFLFVEGFPLSKRPFYTHPDPARPDASNSFDLLFRGMEVVTGGQRLHRYEDYQAVLRARRLDPAPLAGYLEAFRHGMPPHGGFAIGLERWVARLAGVGNIREVTLFPRDLHRLTP
jgi:nondiscriminating aspartyl-tRNA synthetase